MRGVQISYLIEYPQYIPQLAQWLFEEWDAILGEKTPEARIKKLNAHMNRDQLPVHGLHMPMSNPSELQRCVCMISKGAKT
jgi:hypothetical protein